MDAVHGFTLGLFDQPCMKDYSKPCVDAAAANDAVTAGRADALKAARESITLLRNLNNVLPLAADSKVVGTGPRADSMANQLGGWSVAGKASSVPVTSAAWEIGIRSRRGARC